MKNKRYLVFKINRYESGGGLNDLVDTFSTLEEATSFSIDQYYLEPYREDLSFQIYDRAHGKEILFEIPKRQDVKQAPNPSNTQHILLITFKEWMENRTSINERFEGIVMGGEEYVYAGLWGELVAVRSIKDDLRIKEQSISFWDEFIKMHYEK